MRKAVLCGNWKMNKNDQELGAFFSEFLEKTGSWSSRVEVMFAVPYTLLKSAVELTKDRGITILAQNVSQHDAGAYTGEISTAMLQDVGVQASLIGHSERRQYFNETDSSVSEKTQRCLQAGLLPMVCVGETLEQREAKQTATVVASQIAAVIDQVKDPEKTIFAYEPVWAIGTGLTASNEQAQEVHAAIRQQLAKKYGEDVAQKLRILYGGSAKPGNIAGLLEQTDIDGGLVGGASLKAADFAAMVQAADKQLNP